MQKLLLHAVSILPQRLYGWVIIFRGITHIHTWTLLRSKNCFSTQEQYKPLTRWALNTAIIREKSACNYHTFMNVLKIHNCNNSKRYSTGCCRISPVYFRSWLFVQNLAKPNAKTNGHEIFSQYTDQN